MAIGASTGGPVALETILRQVPPAYPGGILIVQHMPVGFTRSLAERMDQICAIEVREAEEDDPIVAGRAYIGPAGYHLGIRPDGNLFRVLLGRQSSDALHCPSVDALFESVAETWNGPALGVVLTGMGQDGAAGVLKLKRAGGTILAEDESSCVVYGMPKAAGATGCVDAMVPLDQMGARIADFS